ncbi:helix-turn-helix domain-containing protein [Streptomyces sp. NRRL B-1381]|uniref:helix-turn-helix domain-containing protein n=1 Tax=Streptomyces sp. NRRL B-1381 TaxID=1463829 RepID=UPI0004C22DD9|nr:helix-turn-helix domain-containing protein [Streptomyces sp. NRRL B-1381]
MTGVVVAVERGPEAWARLGQKIREAREAQGFSRKNLSEIAGVSEKSIQVAEEGRTPRARWPQSLSLIEAGLGWTRGSMQHVLDGGEPSLAPLQDLPLFEMADDGRLLSRDELASPTDLLRERPSPYTRSVILAELPRPIRSSIGDVLRFGRRAQNFGASTSLVEEYERVVEALILDLAANSRGFDPSFEPGALADWERAESMDPVVRKNRMEREIAADRRRRSARADMAQLLSRDDDVVVVGDDKIEASEVLLELRKLAEEVAGLSEKFREGQQGKDDEESA